jgi:hypothetical protein
MRRVVVASTMVVVSLVGSGIVAWSSVGVSPAGASGSSSKSAFCGANDQIDRASAKVTSNTGFLAILKSHSHDLAVMKKNAPSGALGQTVKEILAEAQTAVSSNDPNALNNLPEGSDVDTYCGVNGYGKPLPSYFGKGTSTSFCTTFLPVYEAVGNAEPNQTAALSALTAHQAQVSQLASELSSLPKSIKAEGTAAVKKAETAIATKNPAAIGSGSNDPASYVALYCGQNQ